MTYQSTGQDLNLRLAALQAAAFDQTWLPVLVECLGRAIRAPNQVTTQSERLELNQLFAVPRSPSSAGPKAEGRGRDSLEDGMLTTRPAT